MELPPGWLADHLDESESAQAENNAGTFEERSNGPDSAAVKRAHALTGRALDELRERHPLLIGQPL